MPLYNYLCRDCRDRAAAIKGQDLTEEELWEVIFETSHSIHPSPEELHGAGECPRCLGHNTAKTYQGTILHTWVRGYGYLDRAGCNRDMNLCKLTGTDAETGKSTDPYGHMREAGEAEDLAIRLRRAGKHNPKPKHYQTGGSVAEIDASVRAATGQGPVSVEDARIARTESTRAGQGPVKE